MFNSNYTILSLRNIFYICNLTFVKDSDRNFVRTIDKSCPSGYLQVSIDFITV